MTDTQIIADEPARQRALNPQKSFIVQAPAGSGKTELLTQRVLVLLANVSAPEEILAITFTKKAAFEMRSRIINALKKADTEPEPITAHAKKTWILAKQALQQNKRLGWQLLANPNRLHIQTMDSFNASLIKHLPILSHFGAPPEIADDTTSLYREAVQEFLSHLEENVAWADSIAQLLVHMDNDLNKIQQLLINMLAKRDQWLPYILMADDPASLREQLEEHLATITADALIHLHGVFPSEHRNELLILADFAARHLKNEFIESPILHCQDLSMFPRDTLDDKPVWLGFCELFFTNDFSWRKRLDKNLGFPAASTTKNATEKAFFTDMKNRMLNLIDRLKENDHVKNAFQELKNSPHPVYHETQWQALSALYQALRIAVAQLKLTFRNSGKIDYIENAQAALLALGSDEAPTDLALALDYQIKHILIDEFQDTSNSQFRLINKLIAGWEPNDGRTLFVVGDPMQSIYRFREAEVGLFIRARKTGINHIHLEPITLSVNFRSTPTVVDWINSHFKKVFPSYEDICSGAVPYSECIANVKDHSQTSQVILHPILDEMNQEQCIVELIRKSQSDNPNGSIAILVRSRNHLIDIIPQLIAANIPYRAIDIDRLNSRSIIQDMIALTRALLHTADRIAWLSVLRAPWCGLSLSDLLAITDTHSKKTLWENLLQFNTILGLSDAGKERLNRIIPILKTKIAERRRQNLREWVENTWLLLGGPACTEQSTDLLDVKEFFELLEKLDQGGDLSNLNELSDQVRQLFAAPNNQTDNILQIMTIHTAKGLEFDTVILPHLQRKSPHDDKQLLLWMERARDNQQNALILAPISATGADGDPIYDFVKRQHAIKMDYETSRLLYVAVTRAKKDLHLLFNLETNHSDQSFQKPLSKSLLEKLWIAIQDEIVYTPNSQLIDSDQHLKSKQRSIKRLSLDWKNPFQAASSDKISRHQKAPGFQLHQYTAKHIGTLVHQILQQIGSFGLSWWQTHQHESQLRYIQSHLHYQGVLESELANATQLVSLAIHNTLNDSNGLWILKNHAEAQCELSITTVIDHDIKSFVIDRTFVDTEGTRWIIDYKTTLQGETPLDQFLQIEQKKHAKQLLQYQQALHQIDNRPIRIGLYFPLIPAWFAYLPANQPHLSECVK